MTEAMTVSLSARAKGFIFTDELIRGWLSEFSPERSIFPTEVLPCLKLVKLAAPECLAAVPCQASIETAEFDEWWAAGTISGWQPHPWRDEESLQADERERRSLLNAIDAFCSSPSPHEREKLVDCIHAALAKGDLDDQLLRRALLASSQVNLSPFSMPFCFNRNAKELGSECHLHRLCTEPVLQRAAGRQRRWKWATTFLIELHLVAVKRNPH